jgi:hypothetical protein
MDSLTMTILGASVVVAMCPALLILPLLLLKFPLDATITHRRRYYCGLTLLIAAIALPAAIFAWLWLTQGRVAADWLFLFFSVPFTWALSVVGAMTSFRAIQEKPLKGF